MPSVIYERLWGPGRINQNVEHYLCVRSEVLVHIVRGGDGNYWSLVSDSAASVVAAHMPLPHIIKHFMTTIHGRPPPRGLWRATKEA